MRSLAGAGGFSLIEVMVASGVLAGAVLSAAQLFAAATAVTVDARTAGEGALLAWQKVEQLRSLAFTVDDAAQPLTDISTDTASDPERSFGGTGLSPSPPSALHRDTPGYVDYLDAHGRLLGGGVQPPGGARYRRRWAIEAPTADARVLRVRVLTMGSEADAARLASVRVRRLP